MYGGVRRGRGGHGAHLLRGLDEPYDRVEQVGLVRLACCLLVARVVQLVRTPLRPEHLLELGLPHEGARLVRVRVRVRGRGRVWVRVRVRVSVSVMVRVRVRAMEARASRSAYSMHEACMASWPSTCLALGLG